MNVNKIDARLLSKITMLGIEKKVPCFIFGDKNFRTKELLKSKNIHILDEYLFINCYHCLVSKKEIASLSRVDDVCYISSCSIANCLMYVSKKILETNKLRCFGEGVGVAIIDTGLSPHFDFLIGRNRVKLFKDFVSGKKNMYDDNGHGTFVTGVCCGSGVMSNFKYAGIAPKCDIFSLKALDGKGEANANKILDAMQWVYDNHEKNNIKVVCMSFGSEPLGANDPIMLGADALWKEGVVVVAAAGNSGPEFQTIKSPGTSSKIITVGGIDDNRYDNQNFNSKFFEIADFSSRGPAMRNIKPDVVAPSVDITSCGIKNPYTTLSGTSVATPMVAGLATLILEKEKNLTPNEVKLKIIKACKPLGFEKNLEGYGIPNMAKLI